MWLLLACAPDDLEMMDDGTRFLADVSEIPERTRLASYGVASLTEDGEDLEDPYFSDVDRQLELVVVDVGDRVRVHAEIHDIDLLLWLDRPDLVDVLHSRVWAHGTSEETGAEFPAGLAVDWDDQQPVAELSGLWLHARMVVPNAAVDQVFVPSEYPGDVDGVYLRPGIQILDVPGGQPVADTIDHTFAADDGYLVPARLLREESGWNLVEATDRELRVRGWVRSDDVSEHANLGVGGCCHGSWGFGSSSCGFWIGPRVELPVGTLLRDDRGAVVGRVREPMSVAGELVDGKVHFSQYTPWGQARLTASPADILEFDEPEPEMADET
jgi:hypothetical protein